jgi:hypothetical protein
MKNHKHTDEARKAMSDAKKKWHAENRNFRGKNHPMYGRKRSDEFKKDLSTKNSKSVRGFKMININSEDKEIKKISYEDIEHYLSEGWVFKSSRLNVNNGSTQKSIYPKDYLKYIDEGWVPGSLPKILV